MESYTKRGSGVDPEQADAKLDALGYGPDGDRQLVETILDFSRLLMEKCGNRSLYDSSERLGDILNTTSLSLLQSALRLSLILAQRYHSRQRGSNYLQPSSLASHYNIDLEKLQKVAGPFPRPFTLGKNAAFFPGGDKPGEVKLDANDLPSLSREAHGWEEWGHVHLLYYPSGTVEKQRAPQAVRGESGLQAPSTPTPIRRSSTQPTPRSNIPSNAEESPAFSATISSVSNTPSGKPEEVSRGGKSLDVPYTSISSSKTEDLLVSNLPQVPADSKYDLLHRIRTAKGLSTSKDTRQQILAIRILAISNLAYVYPEGYFQQKILQHDMEQPKRLQLAYQLAELVHLGASGDLDVSRTVQTLTIQALDALAKHKARAIDVCAALNVNINHGILMFLTRMAVSELGSGDDSHFDQSQEEWRDALLALLRTLPGSSARTPETLVAAGLIPMFVDILNLRTDKAHRVYSRIMEFLDTFVHTVRDALGTLTNAKGFDAISDLIEAEAKTSYSDVQKGRGIPENCKTSAIDYQISYFQQQTLRWLFRFVNHLMHHNGGGYDRILRNLIDSPQLLTSLRLVFENATVFGSHVWSGAVNILSSFINNEPTSYGVIAEAGLSKSVLEAVMASKMDIPEGPAVEGAAPEGEGESSSRASADAPKLSTGNLSQSDRVHRIVRPPGQKLAAGILPSVEAISCIPSAFGAICLNASGLELFQSSHALESLFEIFESPYHVKCMKEDSKVREANVLRILGSSFDELARHHPALKPSIMSAVIVMTARVGLLCKKKALEHGIGTKLYAEDSQGKSTVAGGNQSLRAEIGVPLESTAEMVQGLVIPPLNSSRLPNGSTLVIGDVQDTPLPDLSVEAEDEDEYGLTVTDYVYCAARFLATFFENQTNCTYFIESGGVEFALDFITLAGNSFDFHGTDACVELAALVHMMAESRPHLVIPSLINRSQIVVNNLKSFWLEPEGTGFFTSLFEKRNEKEPQDDSLAREHGTYFVRNLVAALAFMDLLRELFSSPLYQTRPSQQLPAFIQVNLAEQYSALVTSLGKLHAACVWEEILLEKLLPKNLTAATKVHVPGPGPEESTEIPEFLSVGQTAEPGNPPAEPRREGQPQGQSSEPHETHGSQGPKPNEPLIPKNSPSYKNALTVRYFMSNLPSAIAGFIHNLGLGLIGKRRMDPYQRQNAYMVANTIADAVIGELQYRPALTSDSPYRRSAYLILILSSFSHLLLDPSSSRPLSHYLTLILFSFKRKNGLKVMKDLCDLFINEAKELSGLDPSKHEGDVSARLTSAYGGVKIILSFFSEIASGKNIVESNQTQSMTSSERDRDRPDYFQPGQFLVDLRMEILPMVRDLWNSEFGVQSTSSIVKCLVDILRSSLDGDYETGAARSSESVPGLVDQPRKTMAVNKDRVNTLTERGFSKDLAEEALYRCNNGSVAAEEYCNAQNWLRAPTRLPPPQNDVDSVRPSATGSGGDSSEDASLGDEGSAAHPFLERSTLAMLLAQASGHDNPSREQDQNRADRLRESDVRNGPEFLTRAFTHILNDEHNVGDDEAGGSSSHPLGSGSSPSPSEQPARRREVATVEDLDNEREKVRSNIIERCLDILNVHHDVSFELADLIAAATKKHAEPESFRKEVGETLVQSLVSLQMEDFQAADKKIAAYAHLLALVLQDRDMYNATLDELKESFSTLVGFVRIPSTDKTTDVSHPWIGHVLLILERLLSDDSQPRQIRWTPPTGDNPSSDDGPAQLEEPLLSHYEKEELFKSLVDVLPRVGKDGALALSVCRILVILTRNRNIANRLGEKRNLQRLFIMVKQLAGSTDARLQGSFMLVLRHIIEDDDTIRQIMRSDIESTFESKSSRQLDTTAYVREMCHLVLRSPELFVEVSNEKLTLVRYDARQRPQTLMLKKYKSLPSSEPSTSEKEKKDQATASEAGPSGEKSEKGKGTELKAPVVERPDGVIHYLLSELLSYKDVDDKDPSAAKADTTLPVRSDTQNDVEMTDESTPSNPSGDSQNSRSSKKQEKPAFKADEHPIYIYRCFLLQCLTELLSSYNRTKVEFINFSPKVDPLAATPPKPRSGILNYLLNVLVPIGTLEHDESIPFKKRHNTSSWTMRVLVALCTKTSEFGGTGRRRNERDEEDEPDLAFVRRFVLEHALRSYKDANASGESLDVKYARLLSLADLFEKMLSGYALGSNDPVSSPSSKQIAKTMFEKHFISALTASIAEIDLNFPMSKRVIKYILRPLNRLTENAVYLSELSEISSPGETEENEISSATSVSDMEDSREETPDLFRHSTLGMLEPRGEGESTSEESEGEEFDDGDYGDGYEEDYGDEMDYDEELPEGDGEVVSEEDEGDDEVGPIEGLPGDDGMDVEVVIDEDEGDGDEEDDDEDEEDDDDDEHEDHDNFHEGLDMDEDEIFAGEITGDRDNDSLGGMGEEDDDQWESEGASEAEADEEETEMMNQFEDELVDVGRNNVPENRQHLDYLFRALNDTTEDVDDVRGDGIIRDLPEDVDDGFNEEDGKACSYHINVKLGAANVSPEDDEIEVEDEPDIDEDQVSYPGEEGKGTVGP